MQERVLGALIIGGIALVGIVWGSVEGLSALGRTKKNEKVLEAKVAETVQPYNDIQISKFDCRMVKYTTKEIVEKKKKKVILFVDLYGYTNNNEEFVIGYKTSSDYVLDVDTKFNVKTKDEELMKNDIYKNYTMTASKDLISILNDENSSLYKFSVGDSSKYRIEYDESGQQTGIYINDQKQ